MKSFAAKGPCLLQSLVVGLALLGALAPRPAIAAARQAETFRLPNGLRIILQNDPTSRLVALQMWVEVGADDEEAPQAGLAHVLEHILFRGSSEQKTGKVAAEVEALGGRINGYTAHDRTVYHMVFPSAEIHRGLELLARLIELPDVGQPALDKEIQVVLEEWKQGQDNPRSRVSRELFKAAYEQHPYGRPIIGTPETLGGITWEMLGRFYHRWYTADNMTLVVSGNLAVESVRKEVTELFSSLRSGPPPSRDRPPLAAQGDTRVKISRAPVKQAQLAIGFPIPGAAEPDAPGLDFIALVLGRGESSRLAQKVKIAAGHVNSISTSTFTPLGPGLFVVHAQLESEKITEALKAILAEIFRLREQEITPSEMIRARVNFVRTFVESRETVQGQANQLGKFQALYHDPNYESHYLRAIDELNAGKLKELAREFFRADRLSVSLVLPEQGAGSASLEEIAALSRSAEHPSGLPAATRVNGVRSATLGNGLRVLIQEDNRLPLVTLHAGVIGGLVLEDKVNNGIHHFIASMLTQGNDRLTATQLVHEVEQLGGTLRASSGNHTLSLTGTFPSQHLERSLKIFLGTLLRPSFPEAELEKKRQEILLQIKNRDERTRAQAFSAFYRTLLRAHPYRLQALGEREPVLRFRREELAAYYQRLASPDRIVLSIVGDVDGEALLGRLRHELSPLPPRPSPFVLPPAEVMLEERRVEKKTAKFHQAHVVLGYPAPLKGQTDYFVMKVLEVILSRIGGRLFVEVRDRLGLAYSVGAFSLSDPFQGAFGIYAAVDPDNIEKIQQGMLRELKRLREERCSEQELTRAKNYLIGNHLITRQTNAAKAADLIEHELFGFGLDYGVRYRESIEKVSAEDILRVARQYLSPDRYVLAIVGP